MKINSLDSNSIKRLATLIEYIADQAKKTDQLNAANKSHRLIENNNLFSQQLFNCESDRYSPYVKEIERRLKKLSLLIIEGKNNACKEELARATLLQIEQQTSSMITALQSNRTMHQAAQLSDETKHKVRAKSAKKRQAEKLKAMAQTIMLSSKQLYEKLNEHREFERRLMLMVSEKEQQRAQCKKAEVEKLSNEVLTLHQRLGRCRKAISRIERDIDFSEKKTK